MSHEEVKPQTETADRDESLHTPWRFLLLSECVVSAAKKGNKSWSQAVALYVVVVTVLLVVLWLTAGPGFVGSAMAAFAAYRLVEIFAVGAGLIARIKAASIAHDLRTIGLYVVQMALIFAILGEVFVADSSNWGGSMPTDRVGWLYLGFTNLLVRGNQFDAKSDLAQALVALNLGSGVFLLSVFVAFAVSKLPSRS